MTPFQTIVLDRIYHLRLTMGVILEYEQLTEKKLCELHIGTDTENMTVLLWLMARRENKALTLEKTVESMKKLSNAGRVEAYGAVAKAINNGFIKSKSTSEKSEFFNFDSYTDIAATIGVSQTDMWNLTCAEFHELQEAYIKRIRRDRNSIMTEAWYSAYFRRVEKMPPLSDYLVDIEEVQKREMTAEEMLAKAKLLNAVYGGTVTYVE